MKTEPAVRQLPEKTAVFGRDYQRHVQVNILLIDT